MKSIILIAIVLNRLDIQVSDAFSLNYPSSVFTSRPKLSKIFATLEDANRASQNGVSKDNDDDAQWESLKAELVDSDMDGVTEDDWIPDSVKSKERKKHARRIFAEKVQVEVKEEETKQQKKESDNGTDKKEKRSPYTEEEEDVIAAMGGKTRHPQRKREEGFLGDCTLQEISTDYSVPISYLADVLCMWGCAVPINIHDRLGDLVTGEQAFSILEAVNSLDIAALHDRYSNMNLMNVCYEFDIDIQDAFEMCLKEGWSLPFGVQTCLRVEQEEELIRVLGEQGTFFE